MRRNATRAAGTRRERRPPSSDLASSRREVSRCMHAVDDKLICRSLLEAGSSLRRQLSLGVSERRGTMARAAPRRASSRPAVLTGRELLERRSSAPLRGMRATLRLKRKLEA